MAVKESNENEKKKITAEKEKEEILKRIKNKDFHFYKKQYLDIDILKNKEYTKDSIDVEEIYSSYFIGKTDALYVISLPSDNEINYYKLKYIHHEEKDEYLITKISKEEAQNYLKIAKQR